jgi:uncharacterized membrane protein
MSKEHFSESHKTDAITSPVASETEHTREDAKSEGTNKKETTAMSPFRRALLRGLGFALPPLLTIVLFLWAWNTIETYVLLPVEAGLQHVVVWAVADIRDDKQMKQIIAKDPGSSDRYLPAANPPVYMTQDNIPFAKVKKNWIPLNVYETVEANPGDFAPTTANAYYHRFVRIRYLPRWYVIPVFLLLFVLILYFLGRFLTAGIGRIFYGYFERLVNNVPIVSNVYSSVKQVTDFAFSETEMQFTRIVAVEYPRKGIWSMGFVTGESMLDIRTAANEPVLSVLMPTSPMPATGFVITVPKSETIDLNITMDQAIQFCVSCGVVVAPHQLAKAMIDGKVAPAIADAGSAQQATTVGNQAESIKLPGQGE